MPPKEKYTDPELREEIKEEVKAGDKGGAPGQWSARKAQPMAKEYKARGGDYTTPKEDKDESQKHLSRWGEEDWQTKEGSGNAKQADGSEKRYLPKKAWDKMSEGEKEETEKAKEEGGKDGKQFVANTGAAKKAREEAQEEANEEDVDKSENKITKKDEGKEKDGKSAEKSKDKEKTEKDEAQEDNHIGKEEEQVNDEEEDKADGGDAKAGQKRSHDKDDSPSKKQKPAAASSKSKSSSSSKKSDEAPAAAGSVDRLPKKGQKVHWNSIGGYVHGEVLEIATEEKDVDGKKVKASEKDPRVVLKSDNGKVAVHKPDAVYFE